MAAKILITETDLPLEQRASTRVLITDENEVTRNMLVGMLKLYGIEATTLYCGDAAIKEYKKAKDRGQPYDVVVLDSGETSPRRDFKKAKDILPKLKEIDPSVPVILTYIGLSQDLLSYMQEHCFTSALYKPNEVINNLAPEIRRLSNT